MLLLKMQTKITKKLFRGLYQYKLVIICAGASWFRGGDMDSVLNELKKEDQESFILQSKNQLSNSTRVRFNENISKEPKQK